jgi:hypothetical protein
MFRGSLPIRCFECFLWGSSKEVRRGRLTTGIHTALAKISLDDASDFAFTGAADLATLTLSAAFLSDFAMVYK